jgi:hypothetical protein
MDGFSTRPTFNGIADEKGRVVGINPNKEGPDHFQSRPYKDARTTTDSDTIDFLARFLSLGNLRNTARRKKILQKTSVVAATAFVAVGIAEYKTGYLFGDQKACVETSFLTHDDKNIIFCVDSKLDVVKKDGAVAAKVTVSVEDSDVKTFRDALGPAVPLDSETEQLAISETAGLFTYIASKSGDSIRASCQAVLANLESEIKANAGFYDNFSSQNPHSLKAEEIKAALVFRFYSKPQSESSAPLMEVTC